MRGLISSLLLVGCLSPLGLLSGCSGEERIQFPEATLEGKITYRGKPVPHALVIVTGGMQSAQGNADAQGNYRVDRVPSGEIQIGVNTDAGRGMMMGEVMAARQTGSAPPDFVDIPSKFFDPTTSEISTIIQDPKGVTTFDIQLK